MDQQTKRSYEVTRRDALRSLGIGAGAALLAGCATHGEKGGEVSGARKPNVLIVFGDQWRGMAMGCAGDSNAITPNIDRLAREGILYSSAFANYPVCTPSRGQLLTGRYPFALGLVTNDLAIKSEEVSIAHILKGQGYRCGYIGKWHLDGRPREKFTPPGPRRLGFDDFWAVWNCAHDYFDAKYFRDTPEPIEIEVYEPDHQTNLAIGFIEEHCRAHPDVPFFLTLSWGPPHFPLDQVPERFLKLYDPEKITLRPNCPEGTSRLALAQYYAACTALDGNLGRLLDSLDRVGVTEDTIVVFTSDHGDMLGSQGLMNKNKPWEESISVPLIVRYPRRIEGGRHTETLACVADIMPTVLGLAGAPIPARVQGTDLSWSALGQAGKEPSSVYLTEMLGAGNDIHTWRGVRTREYLYAEDCNGPWLLYDIRKDPYEQHNLVDAPEMDHVRVRLGRELRSWYVRLGEEVADVPVEVWRRAGRFEEVRALVEEMKAEANTAAGSGNEVTKLLDRYLATEGRIPNRRF